MSDASGVAGAIDLLPVPYILPPPPELPSPVVRMSTLCALLLLSPLVRQTEYSFKLRHVRLRHVSTLFSSLGPLQW